MPRTPPIRPFFELFLFRRFFEAFRHSTHTHEARKATPKSSEAWLRQKILKGMGGVNHGIAWKVFLFGLVGGGVGLSGDYSQSLVFCQPIFCVFRCFFFRPSSPFATLLACLPKPPSSSPCRAESTLL